MHKSPLVAQVVKNLPAMQEIRVQPVGWEDLLKKGLMKLVNIFPWRRYTLMKTPSGP